MNTLTNMKALHDKGMALIYLRPKSKKPFENGWTTQKPKTWGELENSFHKDYNLGVRLGESSKLLTGKYLGVIDCDVKSKSRSAIQEMNAALRDLGIDFKDAPLVMSGRGNGSKHVYVQTVKPMRPFKYKQSSKIVKVSMPGENRPPSKRELKELTVEEIESGVRLRAAWEISFMGTGQQTVLPPSIHPDTGFAYAWGSPLVVKRVPTFDPTPFMGPSRPYDDQGFAKAQADFKAEDVNLYESRLPLPLIRMIETGEGCTDRSASLLSIAMSMCRSGFTDNQILSVLSNPEYFIAGAAYDHTQSMSRLRAVKWLRRYTLEKARFQTDVMRYFDNPPAKEERRHLTRDEVVAEVEEMDHEAKEDSKRSGYYLKGPKGALKPDYNSLLQAFWDQHPYRMVADMKNVFEFNGTHYADISPFEIKAFAERRMNPKPEEKPRQEFLSKVQANHVVRRNFFQETTEGKINFKNGVLTLGESKELIPHSHEFGFRGVLPYKYDESAQCPFFKKWIFDLMLEDRDLTKVLQEFMGYIVRGGEYKYHKALWLGGEGRNGKSTFVDVLKALIGVGNFSVISIRSLMGDKFAGSDMDGKIANFSEETSPEELADSGPFKNLTGDGDIFVQKKYGDPYNFRNKAKLIMTYNRIPDLKDLSLGMLSRPLIVPFRKTIKEQDQDRNIKSKILKELPGIFNFAMRGWMRLESQGGFTESESSKLALQKVKEESCNVFQWVENHIKIAKDPNQKMLASQLYMSYSNTERYAYREIEFYRRLYNHPTMKNRKKRLNDGTYYTGVGIV